MRLKVEVPIPSVNLYVPTSVSWGETGSLGCHTKSLYSMTGGLPEISGNMRKVNVDKPSPRIDKDPWGGYQVPGETSRTIWTEWFSNLATVRDTIFRELLKPHSPYDNYLTPDPTLTGGGGLAAKAFVFMSAPVNYGSRVRANGWGAVATIGDFVKWLIDNKIGVVTESPIVRNQNYPHNNNFSLCRGWIWNPPAHVAHTTDKGNFYNTDAIPTLEQVAENLQEDSRARKVKDQYQNPGYKDPESLDVWRQRATDTRYTGLTQADAARFGWNKYFTRKLNF